jgi:hypothetical protein
VEKSTANPKHPFSRFSTGTRRTLQVRLEMELSKDDILLLLRFLLVSQVDPRHNKNLKYEVFTFFKRYYSANLMSGRHNFQYINLPTENKNKKNQSVHILMKKNVKSQTGRKLSYHSNHGNDRNVYINKNKIPEKAFLSKIWMQN